MRTVKRLEKEFDELKREVGNLRSQVKVNNTFSQPPWEAAHNKQISEAIAELQKNEKDRIHKEFSLELSETQKGVSKWSETIVLLNPKLKYLEPTSEIGLLYFDYSFKPITRYIITENVIGYEIKVIERTLPAEADGNSEEYMF